MRPILNMQISPDEFLSFYWLKAELTSFCRDQNISAAGSKLEIAARIAHYLRTREVIAPSAQKKSAKRMPTVFTLQTVIGHDWRCSQSLRAFFEHEIGVSFFYSGALRDFIHNGAGKTLQDAVQVWLEDQRDPAPREIALQFEYNRFTRAFHADHPGSSRDEVVTAWMAHRSERRS